MEDGTAALPGAVAKYRQLVVQMLAEEGTTLQAIMGKPTSKGGVGGRPGSARPRNNKKKGKKKK
eukprot:9502563-Pyramimonas_sp.AAC.2